VPDTHADAYRAILGRNISAERGRLQLSQTIVAERMREFRFGDWHQQTVASVEKGKRRVTAEEILGLVVALETTLPRLLAPVANGGDQWVELPSGSGQQLPSSEIISLAKGNRTSMAWYQNKLARFGWPTEEDELQPVAAAIVTSRLGVLVGRRNDGKPPWTFIAGEVEPGETAPFAAGREVKEETGLEVEPGDVIGERVHPKTGRTMIYVAAKPVRPGDLEVFVGDTDELAEVRWVSLAEADELLPGMFEPVREHLAREIGEG
jgi:8-oxo-dGTP pyrophosphatase MutT (NUDIX family)